MHPISYLTPIVAACAVVAWLIVVRKSLPSYVPVAALLTWWTVYTLARASIWIEALGPARAALGPDSPYPGTLVHWYYAEITLRLTWPFAILAACAWMFVRHRAWWTIPMWGICAATLCFAYPGLRRDPQRYVEAAIESSAWIASAWCVWYGHRRLRADAPECYVPTALILGAQLAVILVVRWIGSEDQSIARAVQGVVYATLLGYQGVKTFRPSWTS